MIRHFGQSAARQIASLVVQHACIGEREVTAGEGGKNKAICAYVMLKHIHLSELPIAQCTTRKNKKFGFFFKSL